MSWKLNGIYFETCNCDVACPCVFLSAPTEGECTVLVGWHIESGSFDDLSLDGLNVALAVHTPGHMMETRWRAAAYVDDRADEAQRNALLAIFGGQAGGHPARLASHVGEGACFATTADRSDFSAALEQYCIEASRIVSEFSAGWYAKHVFGGDGRHAAALPGYGAIAVLKIVSELQRKQSSDA